MQIDNISKSITQNYTYTSMVIKKSIQDATTMSDAIDDDPLKTEAYVKPGKPIYFCGLCGSGHKYPQSLKIHTQSVHEGIRFHCKQCNSTFSNKNSLSLHRRSVHEGVFHFCKECDFKSYLSRHDYCRITIALG